MFKNIILNIIIKMLPDWSDAEAVRQFVLKIIDFLENLAAATQTTIDDTIVAALKRIAGEQETWKSLYELILGFLSSTSEPSATDPSVLKVADDAKIDPVTIIAIIKMAIELIKWWRENRQ
jgi:hypothetical protein